ncbi:MAG: type II 3-dehydroquinate dehydratase [Burkholderiales bacterium]|jgi:3-dehydroquinate dehydratase-2|nr:type II 3-dehydroquinate dehydratase [Burkholderiales bacterium]
MSEPSGHLSRILVLHGPNLNLLGKREPEIYGTTTLEQINQEITRICREKGANCDFFQSNHEGALIDRLHQSKGLADFLVINPGAFTHTSIALRDAISAISVPFIEVHLSNVYAREAFRHKSLLSDLAVGVITGLGPQGYYAAVQYGLDYKS